MVRECHGHITGARPAPGTCTEGPIPPMDTLITPNVVMLTALVVWTLGALTLYLVYCRHGEPSAPHSRVSPAPAGEGGLRVESWTPVRGDRWVARLTRLYGRIIDVVGSSGPWRAARALCS